MLLATTKSKKVYLCELQRSQLEFARSGVAAAIEEPLSKSKWKLFCSVIESDQKFCRLILLHHRYHLPNVFVQVVHNVGQA